MRPRPEGTFCKTYPSGYPPLQNVPLEPGQNVPGTFYKTITVLLLLPLFRENSEKGEAGKCCSAAVPDASFTLPDPVLRFDSDSKSILRRRRLNSAGSSLFQFVPAAAPELLGVEAK